MQKHSTLNCPATVLPYADSVFDTTRNYLMAAALQQLEMVRYYVESEGLHPDTTLESKPTALCYAALKGNYRLMRYLLNKGADVNRTDALAMTPLHYAVLGGCLICISLLIGHGAALNAVNYQGQTPLRLSGDRQHPTLKRELLERHGAREDSGVPAIACFH